jgi:flagellar biosynthesis/type III secretory pathway M-ring protein FliF/YscJ
VLTTPAGSLVNQSVSVVVDRAHLGSIRLATLRRLVTASAGIVASRGDRISIVVTRFAKPAPVRSTASGPLAWLMPYVVPAIWALGAILAVLILGVAFRGGRRPASVGSGIQRA